MKVAVIGAPSGFELELARVGELQRVPTFQHGLDLLQGFYTRRAEIVRELPHFCAMGARSVMWICYPKARALGTDLHRDLVRTLAARHGLKVVGVAAIDATWTGLRVRPS